MRSSASTSGTITDVDGITRPSRSAATPITVKDCPSSASERALQMEAWQSEVFRYSVSLGSRTPSTLNHHLGW